MAIFNSYVKLPEGIAIMAMFLEHDLSALEELVDPFDPNFAVTKQVPTTSCLRRVPGCVCVKKCVVLCCMGTYVLRWGNARMRLMKVLLPSGDLEIS